MTIQFLVDVSNVFTFMHENITNTNSNQFLTKVSNMFTFMHENVTNVNSNSITFKFKSFTN